MEIKINIEKKHVYILSILIILMGGTLFVQAYGSGSQPAVFGHSAEELEIDVTLECVSGNFYESDGATGIEKSTEGNQYQFTDVFSERLKQHNDGNYSPTLTCINGWILTGCAAGTGGLVSDNDESMVNENECRGDQITGSNRVFARCCRIV